MTMSKQMTFAYSPEEDTVASNNTDWVRWSFSGLADAKIAEAQLEMMKALFESMYNSHQYFISTGISETVYGWKAELDAQKDNGTGDAA